MSLSEKVAELESENMALRAQIRGARSANEMLRERAHNAARNMERYRQERDRAEARNARGPHVVKYAVVEPLDYVRFEDGSMEKLHRFTNGRGDFEPSPIWKHRWGAEVRAKKVGGYVTRLEIYDPDDPEAR